MDKNRSKNKKYFNDYDEGNKSHHYNSRNKMLRQAKQNKAVERAIRTKDLKALVEYDEH